MGRAKKHHVDFFEVVSALFLLLLIFLTVLIAAGQDISMFTVLLGFFPTILVIVLSMVIHEHYAEHKTWLWLIPVGINVAFFFIAMSTPSITGGMNIELLTGANFLLSIIYMIIVSTVFLDDFKKEIQAQKETIVQPAPKTLQEYIHSIEDKSKALNFVIGRVYSKYHGGSRNLRGKLRIPAEWYNEFSLIGVGTERMDKKQLLQLIQKFEDHLNLFFKSEKEVLGFEADNLTNLIRDIKGADRVIDVLDRNDKDPAKSYFEGALDFCKKVKAEIKEDTLKLVKNNYVDREEDKKLPPPPKKSDDATKRRSSQKLGGLPGQVKHP